MSTFFEIVGLFFPVIGLIITFVLAIFFSGLKRWVILFLAPLAIIEITFLIIKYGGYKAGAMIPAILTGFLMIGLVVYYPILIIWAIVAWRKSKKSNDSADSDIPIPKPPEQ